MQTAIQKIPGSCWQVIRTRPRCEKKVADFAQRRGMVVYLPLRRRLKRYQRRMVETFIPFFTGYVFICFNEEQELILREFSQVATILRPDSAAEERLIRELNEVQRVEQAVFAGKMAVRPELVPGKLICIEEGPFSGVSGVILRRQGKTRLCVNVEMIGQAIMIELDVDDVGLH